MKKKKDYFRVGFNSKKQKYLSYITITIVILFVGTLIFCSAGMIIPIYNENHYCENNNLGNTIRANNYHGCIDDQTLRKLTSSDSNIYLGVQSKIELKTSFTDLIILLSISILTFLSMLFVNRYYMLSHEK